MKKITKSKLSLRTATVRSLDTATLVRVNGGLWPTAHSCGGCTLTSTNYSCATKSFFVNGC